MRNPVPSPPPAPLARSQAWVDLTTVELLILMAMVSPSSLRHRLCLTSRAISLSFLYLFSRCLPHRPPTLQVILSTARPPHPLSAPVVPAPSLPLFCWRGSHPDNTETHKSTPIVFYGTEHVSIHCRPTGDLPGGNP